jgi:hypothetical protein
MNQRTRLKRAAALGRFRLRQYQSQYAKNILKGIARRIGIRLRDEPTRKTRYSSTAVFMSATRGQQVAHPTEIRL